jgi:hypothetical protein
MDEATRMIIAYTLLLLGIPILAAKIIWFIPGVLSGKILMQIAYRLDQIADDAVEGFISLILACLVFEQMQLQVVSAVPIILIIVNSIWNWVKEEAFKAYPFMAGIVVGFFNYPKVLPLLQMNFTTHM